MTRLSFVLMLVVYMAMFMNIVIAQEKEVAGGTFKGEVIDVTPQQKPIPGVRVKLVSIATGKEYTVLTDKKGAYELKGIPAGRYTISVSKKGFGDRVGKSKVVAAGGEVYDRIKMRKKENIFTFFAETFGIFLFSFVIAFVLIFTVAE